MADDARGRRVDGRVFEIGESAATVASINSSDSTYLLIDGRQYILQNMTRLLTRRLRSSSATWGRVLLAIVSLHCPRPLHHATRKRPSMLTILEHPLAVDPDVANAGGELVGVCPGGMVLDRVGIEDDDIGQHVGA